jgi:hypothetical protein
MIRVNLDYPEFRSVSKSSRESLVSLADDGSRLGDLVASQFDEEVKIISVLRGRGPSTGRPFVSQVDYFRVARHESQKPFSRTKLPRFHPNRVA